MTTTYAPTPMILESRDVYVMERSNNDQCRKCSSKLREGDLVVRIGLRPAKYFHKDCFKQY